MDREQWDFPLRCPGCQPKRDLGPIHFRWGHTWSHSLDDDSLDRKACRCYLPTISSRYANSVFNLFHRFTFSWVYNLTAFRLSNHVANTFLSGCRFSGITKVQTGFPFSGTTSTDFSNRGSDFFKLRNRVCNRNLPGRQRTPQHWFDTSCFPLPAANTIGNASPDVLSRPALFNQDLGLPKISESENHWGPNSGPSPLTYSTERISGCRLPTHSLLHLDRF